MSIIPYRGLIIQPRCSEPSQVTDLETAGMLALLLAERLQRRISTPDQAAIDLVTMTLELRRGIARDTPNDRREP
jgi:hypothetical protein